MLSLQTSTGYAVFFKADFCSYRFDMYISMLKGSIINIKP